MDKAFMEKTSFSEICKMMKSGSREDWKCLQDVFDLALLFLPELICPEVGLLGNLSTGVDLLGAKSVIKNSGKLIQGLFTKKSFVDFSSRYENAQAAQVLMIFSAYFDSMWMYVPDESREIALSDGEKLIITEKSLEEYSEWIKKRSLEHASQETRDLLEFRLDIRTPLESETDYQIRIKEFYKILNKQFICFFEKLSFGEQISDSQKDRFMAVIRNLPGIAFKNYKKQYYELKNTIDDFRIWADTQEHIGISEQIDVGFQKMTVQIVKYLETHNSKGTQTLEKYAKKYEDYIADKLVKTTEIDVGTSDDAIFPAKKEIFIPQSFKALQYKKNMLLEPEKTWGELPEMDEIGKFIADTLRHSAAGNLPLLILGVPGAGKTLLCHMLAAQILSHEYHVLIIRLRDAVADDTIAQQINEQIERDFANRCTWNDISDRAISKPLLLIFDGYDELLQASGRTYADYVNKISEFQRQQRVTSGIQVKCILTSRTTLIDKASIPRGTTVIRLSDFNESRIKQWSEIWNTANRPYFESHNLESFSVEPSSKIYELAKQPLLLLLLALYDSNENALKKHAELTGAQLYDRLIKEFITREQRKDAAFLSYSDQDQSIIIDREMFKVSIAALGMYNRRALYIRSEDLEKDLDYLLPDAEDETAKTQVGILKTSEKLLGSFFFIHRSDSRGSIQQADAKNAAYEFLHNTFGEFLTANFIVTELYNKLRFITMLHHAGMMGNWVLDPKKNWFAGLSYAPLSSRPIVAKMVKEWAMNYFAEQGLEQGQVIFAMNYILQEEVGHIINGQEIFTLNEILSENGNPFEKKAYLVHLACYSLNLLSLGALVCGNSFSFSCDNNLWDKLICLWRYAFSEEELLDVANIFGAERDEHSCRLRYLPAEEKENSSKRRILRLARIDQAIGDTLSAALISTILGDGDTDSVLKVLDQNKLDISAKYLWNKSLRAIGENLFDAQSYECLLESLAENYLEQGTPQDIFFYYLLLDYLIKYENKILDSTFFIHAFEMGLRILERLEGWTYHNEVELDFCVQLERILISMIEQLPLRKTDLVSLLNQSLRSRNPEMYLIILTRLLKEVNAGRINRQELSFYLEERAASDALSYNYNMDRIVNTPKRMKYSFSNYFELTYQILQFGANSFPRQQIDSIITHFFRVIERTNTRLSAKQLAIIIRCINQIKNIEPWSFECKQYFGQILSHISILKIYKYSPDAAYDLCCLLEEWMTIDPNCVKNDLTWIIEKKGDDIPVKFYRKIRSLLDILNGE